MKPTFSRLSNYPKPLVSGEWLRDVQTIGVIRPMNYLWQLMRDNIGAYDDEFWGPASPWFSWRWVYWNAIQSHAGRAWGRAWEITGDEPEGIPS